MYYFESISALEYSAFLDFSISCNYILDYTSKDLIHYYPPKVLFCSVIHEIELTMLFWFCWQNSVCKSWLDNGTMIWSRVPENTSSRALMTSLSSFGPQKRIKNLLVTLFTLIYICSLQMEKFQFLRDRKTSLF